MLTFGQAAGKSGLAAASTGGASVPMAAIAGPTAL